MLRVEDIALLQRFANFGRAIFAVHLVKAHGRDRRHANTALPTEAREAFDGATAIFAKAVIFANDDMFDAEALMQDDFDKLFIIHIAQGVVERQLKQKIDTQIAHHTFAQPGAH